MNNLTKKSKRRGKLGRRKSFPRRCGSAATKAWIVSSKNRAPASVASRKNERQPVAAGVLACRRAGASRPAEKTVQRGIWCGCERLPALGRLFRAAGRAPYTSGGTPDTTNFRPKAAKWDCPAIMELRLARSLISSLWQVIGISELTQRATHGLHPGFGPAAWRGAGPV